MSIIYSANNLYAYRHCYKDAAILKSCIVVVTEVEVFIADDRIVFVAKQS